MNNYTLTFISTFIDSKLINELINSIIDNNKNNKILCLLVNQTNDNISIQNNSFSHFIEIKTTKRSLSSARNIAIKYILENDIKFEHLMFPDDDSTFTSDFFDNYNKFVSSNQNYLIDVYCKGTSILYKYNSRNDLSKLDYHNYDMAMSVNMIISFNTFCKVKYFDELLGVGAKYGAGEDADYYIKACKESNYGFIYLKSLFNYHPSHSTKHKSMSLNNLINKYINYGNGAIFMLCKHKMYKESLIICLRALGGSFFNLLKLEFKLSLVYFIAFFSRLYMFLKCIIIQ